jgi:peptide deformylase
MATMKIMVEPAPILRERAREITGEEISSGKFKSLISDMIETMKSADGVGLAAPQVGERVRIFIAMSPEGPLALINPVITQKSWKTALGEEGCLSVPGRWDKVKRFKSVKVRALTADGDPVEFEAKDMLARIIQHEIDHLDGILFIDKVEGKVS